MQAVAEAELPRRFPTNDGRRLTDWAQDVDNQKGVGGAFITLEDPGKPMVKEVTEAGRYKTRLYKDHPKMQILTVEAGSVAESASAPRRQPIRLRRPSGERKQKNRGDAVRRRRRTRLDTGHGHYLRASVVLS